MAKKRDKDLLETLRKSGLRKKVARALTGSDAKTTRGKGGKQSPLVTRTVENLRTAALELEKRVGGPSRSGAAKKAASTRKLGAARRSAAARKAAKTRAKRG
jgi:hypothetical protein